MPPLEALFAEHRRHYEPGTLDRFLSWFERSGHGAMLENPFLRQEHGRGTVLGGNRLSFSRLNGVTFANDGPDPWHIKFTPTLDGSAESVDSLFWNFVRCTAHTHLFGDFRLHLGLFTKLYAGPRYLLFDGAGTCLLLGVMFQSLARRLLDEKIDLYYSHSANKELTHAFGSWRGAFFVDADQKTWAPLDAIDRSAVFGFLFQQLGVSAHQIYRRLTDEQREFLFTTITRDYFLFYDGSIAQYMYRRHQDIVEVGDYFRQAREKFCSPLAVEASDFSWKDELRREAATHGIEHPFFLAHCSESVPLAVPPQGTLKIGLDPNELPEEAGLLATLFLGRVPAALTVPLVNGNARLRLPEFPWMMAFGMDVGAVTINGRRMHLKTSGCGRFRIIGMGELEHIFDLAGGHDDYAVALSAPGVAFFKVVLPFNAFALAADLVRVDAAPGPGRAVTGRIAA